MAEQPAIARCLTPVSCWVSSATLRLSVDLGHGLQVSARAHLPNKRCKVCRGDVSNAAVSARPDTASPEQIGGLAGELQKRIEGHGDVRGQLERGAEPIDPDFYARWLKSKGSLDEAETCIRVHAAWREAFVTSGRIQEDEVARELAAKKAFLQGCDREGHPVLIVWAARHDMGDRSIEETKRFICYCLDNTIAAADFSRNPRGQILCLFDLSGLRTRNLDVKALQAVFELLQSHYPERLHALWFLNAPFIFWGVWRLVRPFIRTEETKSKIVFLSGAGREAALRESISADVLPEVYGGDAELVPVDEAALKQLMQRQQRKHLKQAAKRKALTAEAVKSSRIASAGRALTRWSSSAWSVAKKPAVIAWARVPHWQRIPRVRFWHSDKAGAPSRTGALSRTLSRHFSLRRPTFGMRQRPRRPPSGGAKSGRPLLRQMLSPLFLIEVFRLLTISAAQALYYVWSHAVPLRLQRPRGDSPRLPSAVPGAAASSLPTTAESGHSDHSSAAPAESVPAARASAACSSGTDGEERDTRVRDSASGAQSSSTVQVEEHASRPSTVDNLGEAAGTNCTPSAALQQQVQLLVLLLGVLLIGLAMLAPEFASYMSKSHSRTMWASTLT